MVNQKSLDSVVNGNNKLAFDLYSKYKSKEGNMFFSPYSISTALAMTYEGAKGQTAKEMKKVLHFPSNKKLREGSVKLIESINSAEDDYKLSTANALWAQEDYKFLQKYFEAVEKYYGGKVTNMDFKNNPDGSREKINKWVEDKTYEKIKDLIPSGALNDLTRLVLTNAVYFKSKWLKQFDKEKTYDADFKMDSGNMVKAKMMLSQGEKSRFNYAETDIMQALELPYVGDKLSMLILLPKENLSSLEGSLNAEMLAETKQSLAEYEVHVHLPKFKFETKYFMANTLKKMGMPTAFLDDGSADFSGMTGNRDLYISNVIHQTFIDVNEESTEAAAATAVIMMRCTSMMPPKYKVFRADHPFIFAIQQKETGSILFMGRVSNPTC